MTIQAGIITFPVSLLPLFFVRRFLFSPLFFLGGEWTVPLRGCRRRMQKLPCTFQSVHVSHAPTRVFLPKDYTAHTYVVHSIRYDDRCKSIEAIDCEKREGLPFVIGVRFPLSLSFCPFSAKPDICSCTCRDIQGGRGGGGWKSILGGQYST